MQSITTLLTVLAISFLSACSTPVEKPRFTETELVGFRQGYAANLERYKDTVRRGSPPSDYKSKVDKALARRLKDPDSRKVEFMRPSIGNQFGGLVCGLVNAKNSYGGYNGAEKFAALFDAAHDLIYVQIGPPEPDRFHEVGLPTHVLMVDEDAYRTVAATC